MESRALKRLRNRPNKNGPGEDDQWADPGRFSHLATRSVSSPESTKEDDRIAALPGQPCGVNFAQFAGYVTVDRKNGRELFYYFVESPYDASTKPLILWLNGGPGCSSLGFGAMKELGPFRVNPDGKTLSRNKHAWNNVANVIFLESPAGVGFSYSMNSSDYSDVGDQITAEDTYVFLLNWFNRFPEYKGRDFYIAGESYGGHYVPQIATIVTFINHLFDGNTPFNLRGIFVGNPLLDEYKNGEGNLEFLWSHGVISDEVWGKILANCTFTSSDDWPCFVAAHSFQRVNIDRYNIYAPVCLHEQDGTFRSSGYLPGYDPCIDYYIPRYLNNPDVQKALHARADTNWSGCNLDLAWNDSPDSMVRTIKRLVENGLSVWIYSGDMDSICSLTATRYSVKDLNLTITHKWRPWYTPDNEVGGYVQQYEGGFTLASVRGAGHLVPSFQPKRSLVLLYSFLKGMLPPADIPKMMSNTLSFSFVLIICVAALHANGSPEEARFREFVRSRRSSTVTVSGSNGYSAHEPGARVSSRLKEEYSVSDQSNLKAADKITALPGQPKGVGFNQYGGYVTVDEMNGRALFYYFVEATTDAAAKPLLLWLNGGPGCSSVGYGAMIELGPFRINSDNKTLSRNEYAWNNVANVLFLESPAGVGFSYSNTSSDYDKSGDQRTANDSYIFLVNWLERFPEYKGRAFYISGESYAGHYAPQLAATILTHNMESKRMIINLQGILVGNPCLDEFKNLKGQIDYLWSHGVISDEVLANITKNCRFSPSDGKACSDAMDAFDSGNTDPYDIYGPVCINAPDGKFFPSRIVPGYDPCSNYYIHAYLNNPVVQKALHARVTTWLGCKNLHWKDAPVSMVPTLKWLMEHGLPVWLYSGDLDSVCPLTATRYSVGDLGLAVTEPWRPWTANREVGGYVQQYTGGLVFISVRGAGHQVPYFQPEKALIVVSSFLRGALPPYVKQQ
nr:serine carboxypeptidase II-3 [Oryza sativa Japonica Group]